jgi:glutathione reductase (NADPH)
MRPEGAISMNYDFDLFTIGAGSGGVRASRRAAGYGATVAVAEERELGGTCVNVGCVPKKLLVYASHAREEAQVAESFGWSPTSPEHDWPTFIARKNQEILRINRAYANILDQAGVQQFDGHATIEGPHTLSINGKAVTARHILVATGSRPRLPVIPGAQHGITSDEAFFLKDRPQRVLIVGGGYIAVEFAGIFHGLGSDVTLAYRGDLFLRGFDQDVRTALRDAYTAAGITLQFNQHVTGIEKTGRGLRVSRDEGEPVEVDQVLFAIGRAPLTQDLGLEAVEVRLDDHGAIIVDDYSQTTCAYIHAVGDVTNRINLTPVAIAEGEALARTLFNDQPTSAEYDNVPSAVFSQPPIGTVGMTEEEARMECPEIDVYRSTFPPMKFAFEEESSQRTLMKMIVDRASDRVVGLHMVGIDAGEMLQGFAVALKAGATKAQFDATVGIHPTSAEEFVTMREPVPQPDAGSSP